ncbi:ATP-binding protein [Candidatus Oscillochloris fontis]|uniref:ATP-binding protein n=1 Tax=Candidatus Oscillochloris fontis TaxID=2496868 RepID=UPI00101E1A7C|nr:ATP-binding protein [Candidatus Oscillochloris fontis]
MDDAEISTLLTTPAGPRLAFARERTRLEDLAETMVAFANAQGGDLLLGVSGHTKPKLEGLSDLAAAHELLLEAALACTPPLILPLPHHIRYADHDLLLCRIPTGLAQVYSLHGKYLARSAATNQPLAPDALRRLLIARGDVAWDRSTPPAVSLAELDPHKVHAYARRVGPQAEQDPRDLLRRRGCLVSDDPALPTNAGLLLFAHSVEVRYPQAEITLVHYQGRDMGDAFEREDVRDTLPEAIRRAERWLSEHMRKGSRMVGLERHDWTQFPPAAVREALVNAVAHRDYSVRGEGVRIGLFADRLECYSPGRLPGHVTLENIVVERFSRNESIVQVLADLGLIERLGYGIDRMLRHMEDAGLPPPQFRETAAGFLVTLQGQLLEDRGPDTIDTRAWVRLGLNQRQIDAMIFLAEQRRITNRDLQDRHPDVSPETIRRDLADLVERGMLLRVGEKRATYYILK